jgi:O-antigen ligase
VHGVARARLLKRGHTLSYIGLFLFTVVLYFRPYELFPSLSSLDKLAFWLAVATLLIFLPTQFGLEGRLTARPREVNLLLLLCMTGLLSIPTAINPAEAWNEFNDVFIKAVLMFIVMINVVRTQRRLCWLIYVSLAITLLLSFNAIQDYRLGNFTVEGYRINGLLGGMFGNPNDLALHFVTMMPLAVCLMMASRNVLIKLMFGALAVLTVAAITITYSRGGFLGLLATAGVLAWKLGRARRLGVTIFGTIALVVFIAFAPGNYGKRLLSIFIPSLDPVASSTARRDILERSILISLRHPLFGVGMGNFHTVSLGETVTHNAFTQVSSEMGTAALIIYMMFLTKPLKRLRRIERETFAARRTSRFYYLSIGLQAGIVGYMVSGFFAAVSYQWYAYYLVGYALCSWRIYEAARHMPVTTPVTAAPLPAGDVA